MEWSTLRMAKLGLAVALVPLCVGVSQAGYQYFYGVSLQVRLALFGMPENLSWFLTGAGIFSILAVLVWRPVRVYGFAHELAHTVATWACFGRVGNLGALVRGGEVVPGKSNTLIRLAPFIVPVYALLLVFAITSLRYWGVELSEYHMAYSAVLGFLMAFHLGFTLWRLRRDQPDLQADGWFFSLVIIFLGNVLVLAMVLGIVLSGNLEGSWAAVSHICKDGFEHMLEMYQSGVKVALSPLT